MRSHFFLLSKKNIITCGELPAQCGIEVPGCKCYLQWKSILILWRIHWKCVNGGGNVALIVANFCLLFPILRIGRLYYIRPVGWLVSVTINFPSSIIEWLSPILTKYHHVPPNTTLYWPRTTKYQPLSWTNINKPQTMTNHKQRQTTNKGHDKRQLMTNND